MAHLRTQVADFVVGLPQRLRDPVSHTDLLQVVKTVGAAVLAWVVAVHVFSLDQPFLAPWAALLTVHASVHRTLARGAQQVGATVVGVLLAFTVGAFLGLNVATLAFTLLLGMALGGLTALRDEATTVATTALIVLTTGYVTDSEMLYARLLDTAIGICLGILVNLLVFPPLNDRSAARQISAIDDNLGSLLTDIATRLLMKLVDDDGYRTWVDRTEELERDIDSAWALVRQAQETGRLNPRRGTSRNAERLASYGETLHRLEQAVAETRSMVRTLAESSRRHGAWDRDFRERFFTMLHQAGSAISQEEPERVERLGVELGWMADELSTAESLPGWLGHANSALLVNLRNILDALVHVAQAQPELQSR